MAMFGKKMDSEGGEKPGLEIEVDMAADTSKSAAKDILSAIKSGDVGALDAALKAHREACEYESSDSDESDGE